MGKIYNVVRIRMRRYRVQHVKRNAWLHCFMRAKKVEVEDERREIVNLGLRAIWMHVIKPSE